MISSPPERALPRVAILGRPNVGKSTLFNALIGRRRAITHSTPGVTRDPVESQCLFAGRKILLVDTGGFTTDGGELDRLVVAKSLKTAKAADLVLLVLEADGVTAADEDFMERLRPLSDKLLLVVNKVDTPARDHGVWNFHEFGFPAVIGVSAAHARNLEELKETVSAMLGAGGAESSSDAVTPRHDALVRIAILGKPNSGKSSLANILLGEDKSIVSPVAGTTRDVVEGAFSYRSTMFRILDTAGIRRRTRVKDSVEYYSVSRAIESVREADIVLLMVDSSEGLCDQDKKIAAFAVDQGRGIIVCLSKWDLQPREKNQEGTALDMVRFQFPVLGFAPILHVSAKTGVGVKKLLDTALGVKRELDRRVSTGVVNRFLHQWISHYRIPLKGGYKIRFVTQISVNPVRFIVFVNSLKGFPASYTQYLANCIRRDLGFGRIPVAVELRRSRKGEV